MKLFFWKKFNIFVVNFQRVVLTVNKSYIDLAAVHNVRSQGRGEVCPERSFCGQRQREGSSDADIRTFWWKKIQIFQNLWCFCMDKGANFLRFCRDVFYGRSLRVLGLIAAYKTNFKQFFSKGKASTLLFHRTYFKYYKQLKWKKKNGSKSLFLLYYEANLTMRPQLKIFA